MYSFCILDLGALNSYLWFLGPYFVIIFVAIISIMMMMMMQGFRNVAYTVGLFL